MSWLGYSQGLLALLLTPVVFFMFLGSAIADGLMGCRPRLDESLATERSAFGLTGWPTLTAVVFLLFLRSAIADWLRLSLGFRRGALLTTYLCRLAQSLSVPLRLLL